MLPNDPPAKHLDYLLTAYLFENLSAAGRTEVESHLAHCPDCRTELELLRSVLGIAEMGLDRGNKEYVFEEQRKRRVLEAAKNTRHGFLARAANGGFGRFSWKLGAVAAVLFVCVLVGQQILRPAFSRAREAARSSVRYSDRVSDNFEEYALPPASESKPAARGGRVDIQSRTAGNASIPMSPTAKEEARAEAGLSGAAVDEARTGAITMGRTGRVDVQPTPTYSGSVGTGVLIPLAAGGTKLDIQKPNVAGEPKRPRTRSLGGQRAPESAPAGAPTQPNAAVSNGDVTIRGYVQGNGTLYAPEQPKGGTTVAEFEEMKKEMSDMKAKMSGMTGANATLNAVVDGPTDNKYTDARIEFKDGDGYFNGTSNGTASSDRYNKSGKQGFVRQNVDPTVLGKDNSKPKPRSAGETNADLGFDTADQSFPKAEGRKDNVAAHDYALPAPVAPAATPVPAITTPPHADAEPVIRRVESIGTTPPAVELPRQVAGGLNGGLVVGPIPKGSLAPADHAVKPSLPKLAESPPPAREAAAAEVPPDILKKAEAGDHFESINLDRPDTHSAFGRGDASTFHNIKGGDAGGGGAGGATLEGMIDADAKGSREQQLEKNLALKVLRAEQSELAKPASGGGWGGGNGPAGTGAGIGRISGGGGGGGGGGDRARRKLDPKSKDDVYKSLDTVPEPLVPQHAENKPAVDNLSWGFNGGVPATKGVKRDEAVNGPVAALGVEGNKPAEKSKNLYYFDNDKSDAKVPPTTPLDIDYVFDDNSKRDPFTFTKNTVVLNGTDTDGDMALKPAKKDVAIAGKDDKVPRVQNGREEEKARDGRNLRFDGAEFKDGTLYSNLEDLHDNGAFTGLFSGVGTGKPAASPPVILTATPQGGTAPLVLGAAASSATPVSPENPNPVVTKNGKVSAGGVIDVWDERTPAATNRESTNALGESYYGSVRPTVTSRNLILPEKDALNNPSIAYEESESRSFDPFKILQQQRLEKTGVNSTVVLSTASAAGTRSINTPLPASNTTAYWSGVPDVNGVTSIDRNKSTELSTGVQFDGKALAPVQLGTASVDVSGATLNLAGAEKPAPNGSLYLNYDAGKPNINAGDMLVRKLGPPQPGQLDLNGKRYYLQNINDADERKKLAELAAKDVKIDESARTRQERNALLETDEESTVTKAQQRVFGIAENPALKQSGAEFQGLDPNVLLGDFGDLKRLGAPTGFVQPRTPASTEAMPSTNLPFPGFVNGPETTKAGNGTLSLEGVNNYTGSTTVTGGSLPTLGEIPAVGSLANHAINFFPNDPETISAQDTTNTVVQLRTPATASKLQEEQSLNENSRRKWYSDAVSSPIFIQGLNKNIMPKKIIRQLEVSPGAPLNAGNSPIIEYVPEVVETRTRKVAVQPERVVNHPVPSVYETRTRKVCVIPERNGQPAVYKDEEYKVCVKPESCTTETIPAVLKDEEYQVVVKPADWKFNSPDAGELVLRGFRALREENPKLAFAQFLRHPDVAHPVPLTDEGMDEDEYAAKFGTRPFVDCARDHLSTFGMDVDTAAYTLARAALRGDKLPPPEAIHTEEFVNYFKQPYVVQGDEAFGVFAESAQSPFADTRVQARDAALLGAENVHTRELLKIGIKSRAARPGERKPAMLTFVVDTSGSMSKAVARNNRLSRLALVKQALNAFVERLTPDDAVGIVGFGDQAELILPRTQARDKQRILDAIDAMTPGGSTNVEAGLNLGYRLADEAYATNAVNRMVLFSDGVANMGEKGPDETLKLVTLFAHRGVDLSTVGIGMAGLNDPMLRTLADAGNGSCHVADTLNEANVILSEKLPPHLNVLARDAKVQVDFNVDTVKSYRLLGYEKRKIADKDFRNDKIDSGDVGHDTLVTVFYEIERQSGVHGALGKVYLRWKDAGSPRLEVVERNYPLEESTYAGPAKNASPDFRFLACVARFAELLRESKWVRHGSYAEVLAELRSLPNEFKARPECAEVIDLVERAQRLSIAKWKSEIATK